MEGFRPSRPREFGDFRVSRYLIVLTVLLLWAGNAFALFGSGVEGDPWLIQSLADFDAFAGDPSYWDDYISLQVDIDLAGRPSYTTAVIAPDTSSSSWFQGTSFTGIFEGNGHVISNLTIDTAGAGNDYLGLFGQIGNPCGVKNLGLENVDITGGNESHALGGLCGESWYCTINNCYSAGEVTGGSSVGGLIGANFSDVSQCYSTGSVSGTNEVGGLIGYLNRLCGIYDCYTHSDVFGSGENVGGFCGSAHGQDTIVHCYSAGTVSGSEMAGGFTGFNWFPAPSDYRSCFWNVDKNPGLLGIGGITDPNLVDVNIIAQTTANMQIKDMYAGWDFVDETDNGIEDIWRLCVDGTQYPILNRQNPAGDFACPDGIWLEDLLYFSSYWLDDTLGAYEGGDLTGEGDENFVDFAIFAQNWQEGISP